MRSCTLVLVAAALSDAVPALEPAHTLSAGDWQRAHLSQREQLATTTVEAQRRLRDVRLLKTELLSSQATVSTPSPPAMPPFPPHAASKAGHDDGYAAGTARNAAQIAKCQVCEAAEVQLIAATQSASDKHNNAQQLAIDYASKALNFTTANNEYLQKRAAFATKKATKNWAYLTPDSPSTDFDSFITLIGELKVLAAAETVDEGNKDADYTAMGDAKAAYDAASTLATAFDGYVDGNATARDAACAGIVVPPAAPAPTSGVPEPSTNGTAVATFSAQVGAMVSIYGDYAIATGGSNTFIYAKTDDNWSSDPVATLPRTVHGHSTVALHGNSAVIRVGDQILNVYKNTDGVWPVTPTYVLDESNEVCWFGHEAIAMDDNYAIVGCPFDNTNTGTNNKAFIYTKTNDDWTTTPAAILDGYISEGRFGGAVALSGDYAIVGAEFAQKVFIFHKKDGVWPKTAETIIDGYTGAAHERFGQSVSISGDYAIVGSSVDTSGSGKGKAFIFRKTEGTWSKTALVELSYPEVNQVPVTEFYYIGNFGYQVEMEGNYAIVTSPAQNKAFIYKKPADGAWPTTPITTITSENTNEFGWSLDLHNGAFIIGTHINQGFYIF